MDSSADLSVAAVLAHGSDEKGPFRRVRMSDGSERVQRPHVTVESAVINRADGTAEDVTDHIESVKIGGGVSCA